MQWWRRLLRIPWTTRRSNQSILKEINCEYSLKGLMLKLKLWCFGHLMERASSYEKTLMLWRLRAREEEDARWWDGWLASLTHGHEFEPSQDIILHYLPEFAQAHEVWYAAVHRVAELDTTWWLNKNIFTLILYISKYVLTLQFSSSFKLAQHQLKNQCFVIALNESIWSLLYH